MRSWTVAALAFCHCGKETPAPALPAVDLPALDAGVAFADAGEDPCNAKWRGDAGSFESTYQRARIAYEAERFSEAAAGFKIIAFGEGGELASYAGALYLDSLHKMKCLAELEREVPRLEQLQCAGATTGAVLEQCELLARIHLDVDRVNAQLMFEAGRDTNDASKMAHAGEAYEALAQKECAKSGKLCDELVYNAAIAFLAGGRSDRAKTVAATMPTTSPLAKTLACRVSDAGC